jgi:hypothetical protein
MRVIEFLSPGWPGPIAHALAAFRLHLAEAGYVEAQNVIIDYRFAEGRPNRLPELAADLVRRQVEVIVSGATVPAALAAKAATSTIPIMFGVVDDPTKLGLVASLARLGGNATGVNYFINELGAKQLGLLHELVPTATRVGLLLNPSNSTTAVTTTRNVTAAASVIGVQIDIVVGQEIDVTAAQLSQLSYQSGSGADTLWVRANDGTQWSGWSNSFTVTGQADTAPTVTGSNVTVDGLHHLRPARGSSRRDDHARLRLCGPGGLPVGYRHAQAREFIELCRDGGRAVRAGCHRLR